MGKEYLRMLRLSYEKTKTSFVQLDNLPFNKGFCIIDNTFAYVNGGKVKILTTKGNHIILDSNTGWTYSISVIKNEEVLNFLYKRFAHVIS